VKYKIVAVFIPWGRGVKASVMHNNTGGRLFYESLQVALDENLKKGTMPWGGEGIVMNNTEGGILTRCSRSLDGYLKRGTLPWGG